MHVSERVPRHCPGLCVEDRSCVVHGRDRAEIWPCVLQDRIRQLRVWKTPIGSGELRGDGLPVSCHPVTGGRGRLKHDRVLYHCDYTSHFVQALPSEWPVPPLSKMVERPSMIWKYLRNVWASMSREQRTVRDRSAGWLGTN